MNSKSLGRFLLVFFLVLAVACVEEKMPEDELFFEEGIAPLLICTSEASTLDIPYDFATSDKRLSQIKEKIHTFLRKLQPQKRETLRLCLLHYISEKKSRKVHWCDHYISYIFHNNVFYDTYGHALGRKLLEAPSPSPLPSIRGTPLLSSSPSPLAPPPFFRKFNDSREGQTSVNRDTTSNAGGSQQSQRHDSSRVVVAVVVTAAVTFVIVGLMFLCYRKCCYGSGGLNHNDERPLLNLSMSDFSVGSLHISFGNSPSSRKNSFSSKNSSETPSPSDHSFYPTKLPAMILDPPGRVNGRVQPPLNPPPGRIGSFAQDKLSPKPVPHVLNPNLSSVSKVVAAHPPPPPPPPPPSMAPLPPLAPIPPRPLKPYGSSRPPLPPPPPSVSNAMKSGFQPPPPPPPQMGKPPPPRPPMKPVFAKGAQHSASGSTNQSDASSTEEDGQKTKLKPFFWDKVLASPDQSMVWHQIKSGSFQFNEEMIESLFGYASAGNKDKDGRKKDAFSQDPSTLSIQIIDHKKAQNLSILLRALNVTTEEVCDALLEGNELPSELIETLLRVAPTPEEELKLRLFDGELSLISPGERFLKILVNIPFAFRRLESLLFVHSLHEEISTIKYSFSTLEVACKELRSSRLFLKLLEAVLKTGNRMNDGTFRGGAQAFKLDTLLKLSDVKGTDGKTTLLHFVVQEIVRSEGIRASRMARENSMSSVKSDDLVEGTNANNESEEDTYRSIGLQVVSSLSSELENVRKVAALDADGLSGHVAKLGRGLAQVNNFLNTDMKTIDEDTRFCKTLESFTEHAQIDISWLSDEEKRIISLVKSTADYFHGNPGKDEGLRLFVIVRDFLIILDKVCKEVRESQRKPMRQPIKATSSQQPSSEERQPSLPTDLRTLIFPAITERRVNGDDSDEDSP